MVRTSGSHPENHGFDSHQGHIGMEGRGRQVLPTADRGFPACSRLRRQPMAGRESLWGHYLRYFLFCVILVIEINMACFLAPTAAAIITTGVKKRVPSKYHLEWLNAMLWGGAIMLAVEHVAHGELVPFPPFITAMQNPADIPVMLSELATVGGVMTLVIVMVWAVMVFAASKMSGRSHQEIQVAKV